MSKELLVKGEVMHASVKKMLNIEEFLLENYQFRQNVLNGKVSDADFEAAKSYALGRFQMGAQTPAQIADYYAEGFFTNGTIVRYDAMPNMIKNTDKFRMIELAREFAASGVKGFATVSSAEKALITALDDRLNF